MRHTLTALLLFTAIYTHAQTICATVGEGQTATLTAPPGHVFISVNFASYGTPNGACGSFTLGGCHATNSMSIAEAALLGQNSASINASNAVFGDPCGGTVKRLYIEATYASTLPLSLLSLRATSTTAKHVQLHWTTADELNTSHFLIERSTDASNFVSLGSIPAKGTGAASYVYTDEQAAAANTVYYRLKMIDKDGRYTYSYILPVKRSAVAVLKAVVLNGQLYINSPAKQEAWLLNANGQAVQKQYLLPGIQVTDISSLATGLYFLKSGTDVVKFVKQ